MNTKKQKVISKNRKTIMIRDLKEFDGHEMVLTLSDEETGFKGYISIHSTVLGPALGGTRMQAYKSEDSALRDVLNLSRAMSYKCALAGLPYGGGKGVIIASNAGANRKRVLKSYARMVERMNGLFKTGTDVGIFDEDVVEMAKNTRHMLGVTKAERGNLSTSGVAALGVFVSMSTVLKILYGKDDFKGRTIAIKGVGKLGGELARLASEAGADVIVADIDRSRCLELKSKLKNIKVVSVSKIYKQAVDIYAPCALGNEFTDNVIAELCCRSIVGGANNQLPDISAGDKIFDKGIIYAPDYIVNAGGLIYVADELEKGGFQKDRVIKRTNAIKETLRGVLSRSMKEKIPTYRIADKIAIERIKSGK